MMVVKIKKAEGTKSVPKKEILNLKIIKACLGVTHPENKINHLEKYKIDVDSLLQDH